MTLRISSSEAHYSHKVPAHRFTQGGRQVYYFTLDLAVLDGLLPQRVDDDVIRAPNRRLTPAHAQMIENYLKTQPGWLLGALMLGIAPEAVEFIPYKNDDGTETYPDFGELRIRSDRVNTMRIFDGQHRRWAIRELLAAYGSGKTTDNRQDLSRASMGIVMYAESDLPALKQMFADASQTKKVESFVAVQFDQRNAFNVVARKVSEQSRLLRNRVEMGRASVAIGSNCLLSISQLATLIRQIEIGPFARRVTRNKQEVLLAESDGLLERSQFWFDEFLSAARQEYSDLMDGRTTDDDIWRLRNQSFVFDVTFLRLLASCLYIWRSDGNDWQQLAKYLQTAPLNRGHDGLLVDASLTSPDRRSLFARRQELEASARYIVGEAKKAI